LPATRSQLLPQLPVERSQAGETGQRPTRAGACLPAQGRINIEGESLHISDILHTQYSENNMQFECTQHDAKFDGSEIIVKIPILYISSKIYGEILSREDYLNADVNEHLTFISNNIKEIEDNQFKYLANGKLSCDNYDIDFSSPILRFDYNKGENTLFGQLVFDTPQDFIEIQESSISINLL